jgi:hypothetical protein
MNLQMKLQRVIGDSKHYHQKLDLIDTLKEAGAKPLFSFGCKNISIDTLHD